MSDELQNFLSNWAKPAQTVSLGVLILDSPALAICDPVGLSETDASNQSMFVDTPIAVGEAHMSVKQWSQGENVQNAFLVLRCSTDDAASWEVAKKVGGANPFDDFEVDYGTVGFMSESLRAEFMEKSAEFEDSAYDEWLWPFIDGEDDEAPDIVEIPLPSGAVFKAVTAPGGNGTYAAFIGRNVDGAIVMIVLDLITPALDLL